jgi:ABC-type glutathione transport system ATPase component
VNQPLLHVDQVRVTLGHGTQSTEVLHGVDLSIAKGHIVGLVGESGSGKSTIAKTVVGIHRPDSGSIRFDGADITHPTRAQRHRLRRRIQMIPQDPYSSLDPRRTVGQALAEALDPRRASVRAHRDRNRDLLSMVGLDPDAITRHPSEFSGGQRQRIAIARALAVEPDLIIADEITSALDLSTQAEILRLIESLKNELDLTILFVSHNLAVVRQISDEVVVMLHGDIVETGDADQVLLNPREDYTQRLVASVPGAAGFSLD